MKLHPVFGHHLEFQGEEIAIINWHGEFWGTVEKLKLKNMGIAFAILSLSFREKKSEIHLGVGVIYPPKLQRTFVKYNCNTRVKSFERQWKY